MSERPQPVHVPIGAVTNRTVVARAVREAWPNQPDALHTVLTRALADPRMPSDALLLVADAMAEVAQAQRLDGHLAAACGADQLRTLLMEAAPYRAGVAL
jgi:hypothetical protein